MGFGHKLCHHLYNNSYVMSNFTLSFTRVNALQGAEKRSNKTGSSAGIKYARSACDLVMQPFRRRTSMFFHVQHWLLSDIDQVRPKLRSAKFQKQYRVHGMW